MRSYIQTPFWRPWKKELGAWVLLLHLIGGVVVHALLSCLALFIRLILPILQVLQDHPEMLDILDDGR